MTRRQIIAHTSRYWEAFDMLDSMLASVGYHACAPHLGKTSTLKPEKLKLL